VVLSRALSHIRGIERAFIFGSWAQRIRGEPGAAPADVDLLVVGEPDRSRVSAACREATATRGREVQPVLVTSADWHSPRTGFLRSLQSQELVPISLEAG